jgi:hypothetical protein
MLEVVRYDGFKGEPDSNKPLFEEAKKSANVSYSESH